MPPRREKNETVLRARSLRREMTLPEGMLWQVLRQRPEGFKFRRQHPIGRCVVDFYCPAARLVIEVDGEAHSMGDRPEWICGVTPGCGGRTCGCKGLPPQM
jgi:very-short-patch-repair endonuclease